MGSVMATAEEISLQQSLHTPNRSGSLRMGEVLTKFSVMLNSTDIQRGQTYFAGMIETLLSAFDPEFGELLNDARPGAALEPLLFAYFSLGNRDVPFIQLLFGYLHESRRPERIHVFADSKGIVYMPRIGYFKTNSSNRKLEMHVTDHQRGFQFTVNGETVPYTFLNDLTVANTSVELCRYPLRTLEPIFRDTLGVSIPVEVKDASLRDARHVENALTIIQLCFPSYYEEVVRTTRRIVLFSSPELNSFASLSAYGAVFLNISDHDDEVSYIEDLVHQCGHVIFSSLSSDQGIFLRVDPDTPLIAFTDRSQETRSVYVALHGLFTEAAISLTLSHCDDQNLFSGRQRHELLGRLAYIARRFDLDLKDFEREEIFSQKGFALFEELRTSFGEIGDERRRFLRRFDLSNQSYNFNYQKFAELNPI
jgi:hypothetical protein